MPRLKQFGRGVSQFNRIVIGTFRNLEMMPSARSAPVGVNRTSSSIGGSSSMGTVKHGKGMDGFFEVAPLTLNHTLGLYYAHEALQKVTGNEF